MCVVRRGCSKVCRSNVPFKFERGGARLGRGGAWLATHPNDRNRGIPPKKGTVCPSVSAGRRSTYWWVIIGTKRIEIPVLNFNDFSFDPFYIAVYCTLGRNRRNQKPCQPVVVPLPVPPRWAITFTFRSIRFSSIRCVCSAGDCHALSEPN